MIVRRSAAEITRMRAANKLVAQVLEVLVDFEPQPPYFAWPKCLSDPQFC